MSDKAELFAHLDEYGYVVLEEVLTVDQVGILKERSVELAKKERELGAQLYLDNKSQRVWNLVNKGKVFADMIQHPSVLEFQEYLLGENCTLSSFTVNLIGSGSPSAGLHIDYPLSILPTPHPSFALCANSIYLLDDFSVVMVLHLGRHTTTLFRLLARKGTLLLFMGIYGMVVAKIVLIRIELLY